MSFFAFSTMKHYSSCILIIYIIQFDKNKFFPFFKIKKYQKKLAEVIELTSAVCLDP